MNKYLKVPTHNPKVCIRILQLNTANPFRRSVMAGPSLLQPPPCRGGVISVHHDPVHGIVANPGNREWVPYPLSFFVVCDNPVHRVMVNWDPPISQYLGLPGGIQKGNTSISPKMVRHSGRRARPDRGIAAPVWPHFWLGCWRIRRDE